MHYKEREIRDEMQAHIEDMMLDLVSSGMEEAEARAEAEKAFGDVESAVQSTIEVEGGLPKLLSHPLLLGVIGYVVLFLVMQFAHAAVSPSAVAGQIQVVMLWWVFIGVTALTALFVHWMIQFVGPHSLYSLRLTMLFTVLVSLSITSVLDIDNFEVNVSAVAVGVVAYAVVALFWKYVSVNMARIIMYGYAVLVTWSTLIEEPLLGFIGEARCLFITPDNVELVGALAACQQVPFVGRATAPLILAGLIGAVYVVGFLRKYVSSNTVEMYKKLALTAGVVALPVVPMMTPDLNNYGELDVLPQKAAIYEVYWDVLGRSPEEKDYLFYARTRGYENLDRVSEVLYKSGERRLKINLLHLEYAGRSATKEEVDAYVESRKTIDDIRMELQEEYGASTLLEELEEEITPGEDPQN